MSIPGEHTTVVTKEHKNIALEDVLDFYEYYLAKARLFEIEILLLTTTPHYLIEYPEELRYDLKVKYKESIHEQKRKVSNQES